MGRYIAYYRIQSVPFIRDLPKKMWTHTFFTDYKPVEVLKADNLEEVFSRMQGEVWSPNGEQRDFIRILGLSHTSMSVGDVIYSEEEDKFYIVEKSGFEELTLDNGMIK